jgi:pimeloyl-ACP methyl ester carboxylesterase
MTAPAASAPTLVLLPGLACDAALWRDQHSALAAAHPGALHVADVHARADSLPEMAALLLHEQPGPLLLAGCSMGGMLALHIWQQAPQRVRGLALLGTTARPDTPALVTLRTQACALFADGRMDEVLRANAMFAFDRAHAARLLDGYLAMVNRAGAGGLIRQNQAVMRRADLRPLLPSVTVPTLVAGGLGDGLTPPDCSRELADAIPGAVLHLLPECGHMLTWEQPAAVTALLLGWLQRCASVQ